MSSWKRHGQLGPRKNCPGGLQRGTIAHKLRELRRLRNRIARYEPILAQPVTTLHADVLNLNSWMSVEAAAWITTHSNIAYPATELIIPGPVSRLRVFDTAPIGHVLL